MPANETTERRHELFQHRFIGAGRICQEVPAVLGDEGESDLVEGGQCGGDLLEDVDARAVRLDYSLDSANLALDAPHALEDVVHALGTTRHWGDERDRSGRRSRHLDVHRGSI